MTSDKDDVKVTEEEAVAGTPTDPAEDPSLMDAGADASTESGEGPEDGDGAGDGAPVISDEALEEAGKALAGAGGGDAGTPGDGDSTASEDDEDGEDDEEGEDGEGAQMSLLDHLGELRVRLTRAFIAIGVGMVACYSFAEQMFDILMKPMVDVFQAQAAKNPLLTPEFYQDFGVVLKKVLVDNGFQHSEQMQVFMDALQKSLMLVAREGHFQYTYPAEAFFAHIKISIVAGLFLVSPYVFAQIWGFIAPGLYAHERKWMVPMALFSGAFFTGGALFGYFQVFPYAFDFFAGFSNEGIQFVPKLNEYLSFCLKLLFAFGLVFELPLFIFFLARLGMVSSTGLRKKRKYAILCAFVLSAVLTPPDPFTQCLMAGPLIVLYEVGIWVAFFFGKKEKRHLKKQAEAEAKAQADLDKAAAGDGEEKE
ncbi:twin-arginine translocase subunit TatC [Pseudodesulfovibrio indicus]|uniref:Sec-independent protein translocase protein TatC n=1 Tax=Pseudodesulfovibrio indicus TaxID=1716143 RepID=A0A126QQS7_9BACT|nr:twin-arginine translocase subunit TatC [Pseudodesulfovibrio indicus]AMK12341.1 preprotein translocase subunit TatC [Pseudodesulfovibrio indicus]TDT90629.1 sec-independent protein translocase protein TatC [Pseudodesulfovibrio indicus]